MDKVYQHQDIEKKWYEIWEKGGYFTPKIDPSKKPFTILLPLPNANDPMHMGHALFTVQDILIRYHRMIGDPTLWLPGGDHAGIETQYVFEKHLSKQGKSRFDFDRETLFKMIAEFVEENKNINRDQMKRLGFSLDWTRYKYSLDPEIVESVLDTFRQLYKDGLIYRDERLVNYCTRCGTGFSDLEIKYIERNDPLYYMKYGPFIIATVRPETKFRDTALATNPKDKRYKKYLGQTFDIAGLLGKVKMTVIADEEVDPKFGTGIMKVTPAHDPHDFELGKKYHLPVTPIIDFKGRMEFSWFLDKKGVEQKYLDRAKNYHGKKVAEARKIMVEDLKADGLLIKTNDEYVHRIATCYKCGSILEPLPIPQWYVKTKPLAQPAIKAVKTGKTKIVPLKRFEKIYFDWLKNIQDWNISRQIVWGPRIPIWYCLDCNPTIHLSFVTKTGLKVSGCYREIKEAYSFDEIITGLQTLMAPLNSSYTANDKPCNRCSSKHIIQETDTFDTWFLSSQWPLTTLGFPKSKDFQYFYPTSVLDTMWDILFFWVARMMMMGLYRAKEIPFHIIHLHCRIVDAKGQKMAKSRGNVMNPIDMVDKYGTDALRFALIFGAAPGSDIAISDDKIRGMRNFSNKLWNIGRFLKIHVENFNKNNIDIPDFDPPAPKTQLLPEDKKMLSQLERLVRGVTKSIENYRFDKAGEKLYEFIWHSLADKYIEEAKESLEKNNAEKLAVLLYVYKICLTLLHPFMPFITEELNKQLSNGGAKPLIVTSWPIAQSQ